VTFERKKSVLELEEFAFSGS